MLRLFNVIISGVSCACFLIQLPFFSIVCLLVQYAVSFASPFWLIPGPRSIQLSGARCSVYYTCTHQIASPCFLAKSVSHSVMHSVGVGRVAYQWRGLIRLRLGLAQRSQVLAAPCSLRQRAHGIHVQQAVVVSKGN